MTTPSSGKKRRRWNPHFEYKVDYNDHFETPLVAYEDILPLLDSSTSKKRTNHVLYDPYFCDGRTAILLRQLGFDKVVHEKRDFYRDVSNNKIPLHDTLLTNPPYSDTHKEKCLEICIRQFREKKRPFFLLMPNYVAARNYYRRILGSNMEDVAYLIPSGPYEYDHPEGTGHEIPPFASLWFCGMGKDKIEHFKRSWESSESSKMRKRRTTFATSLEELGKLGVIPTERRPNPRQRKKRRAQKDGQSCDRGKGKVHDEKAIRTSKANETSSKISKAKKHSRYRDKNGNRTKKRF